jgi:hypothetical protein
MRVRLDHALAFLWLTLTVPAAIDRAASPGDLPGAGERRARLDAGWRLRGAA